MGIRMISTGSDTPKINNPNPHRFEIIESWVDGSCVILLVNYPDCVNYEGNKILVYKDIPLTQLIKRTILDPHFFNDKDSISPIARFRPDAEGIDYARKLAKLL